MADLYDQEAHAVAKSAHEIAMDFLIPDRDAHNQRVADLVERNNELDAALKRLGLPDDINVQSQSVRDLLTGGRYDVTAEPGPGAMRSAGIPDWKLRYKMRTPDHFQPFRKRFDDKYSPDDDHKTWHYDPTIASPEYPEDSDTGITDRVRPHAPGEFRDIYPEHDQDDPEHMFRGISHAEWNDIHNSGQIMSRGDYNLGPDQMGMTSWAPNAGMAHSYAHPFAPWHLHPTHEEPSYIVKVKRPHDVRPGGTPGVPDGELGMGRPIPASDIVDAYRTRVYAHRPGFVDLTPTDYSGKNYGGGSAHGADTDVVWEQVPPEEYPGQRTARTANAGENWVYLMTRDDPPKGGIAKGIQPHHNLLHRIPDIEELDGEPILGRLSNTWLAQNGIPQGLDYDVARGTYDKKGRPQVWESNIDRNHVYDAALAALQKTANEMPPMPKLEDEGGQAYEKMVCPECFSDDLRGHGAAMTCAECGADSGQGTYMVYDEGNPVGFNNFDGTMRPFRRHAGTQTKDYEGEVGNRGHVTRVETGTIPTAAVANLMGARGEVPGEHRNKRDEQWDRFRDDVVARGIQDPIFITVDPGEAPVISEGNHRRDAAVEGGLAEVPVEIRYFGHAEQEGAVTERTSKFKLVDPTENMYAKIQGMGWDVISQGPKAGKWAVTIRNQQGGKVERTGNTLEQAFASALTWAWQHSHMSKETMDLPIDTKKTLGQVFASLRPNKSHGNYLGLEAHKLGYTADEFETFLDNQEQVPGWKDFRQAALVAYASRGWTRVASMELQLYSPEGNIDREQIQAGPMTDDAKARALQGVQSGKYYRAAIFDPMSRTEVWASDKDLDNNEYTQRDKDTSENPYGWKPGDVVYKGEAPVSGDWAYSK